MIELKIDKKILKIISKKYEKINPTYINNKLRSIKNYLNQI